MLSLLINLLLEVLEQSERLKSSGSRCPRAFILTDFKNKEADLVYKVNIDGSSIYFYLLELQSSVDFQLPYRFLLYMLEIWRTVLKDIDTDDAQKKNFRLPVIVPCVLYNGTDNWTVKRCFKETLFKYEEFGDLVLDCKYILFDI
ncbi:UNVERIFIED_CONTAM: putative YhgA-like transposase [Acetivibrio alkalicellulosi]